MSPHPPLIPTAPRPLQLIIALGRALQALEQVVGPHLVQHGLSLNRVLPVLEVLHHKGPLRLGEIRDRILLTGASTTYVVKKLEERGVDATAGMRRGFARGVRRAERRRAGR